MYNRYGMARRGNGLWIAAGISTLVVAAAVLVDPASFGRETEPSELENLIEKAATYYEFEHYDRAAETYQQAADMGMSGGEDWYRYAHSLEESGQPYEEAYLNAYRLLLEQAPYHEYFGETERVLSAIAIPFDYQDAKDGAIPEGTVVVVVGMIYRVRHGRSDTGVDTLFVDTKPDDWFRYLGEPVRVLAPKNRTYQQGDLVSSIGWFDGWCDVSDDAGLSTSYPCVVAAGVTPAS